MDGKIGRRTFLGAAAGLVAGVGLPRPLRAGDGTGPLIRGIHTTGATVPAIGLGTWLTFDAGPVQSRRDNCHDIMREFFRLGGGMIDSSPMYASAQDVIGEGLSRIPDHGGLFSATKVWIPGRSAGIWQMEGALELWGLESFDLLYVHNLVDWRIHLPWMRDWQRQGRVGHIGVTTSHGRRHEELLEVMGGEAMDCVQFTYNIEDREAEKRLLPMAADRGLAVVANRPFRGGSLFRRVRGRALPAWAAEIDCENWAQFFLKFILSHPAVTCAIPATSQLSHLRENMGALHGRLPDAPMRREMAAFFDAI